MGRRKWRSRWVGKGLEVKIEDSLDILSPKNVRNADARVDDESEAGNVELELRESKVFRVDQSLRGLDELLEIRFL